MISLLRSLLCILAAAILLSSAPRDAQAQAFSAAQRSEIESIIKDYLLKHPEVIEEVMKELEKRQSAAESAKAQKTITDNAQILFNSPRQVTLGNPKGDVTMVEFFDYNCGYCKRAMTDMLELMKADPNLRVVLKEFPVLGEGSVQAAQVAIALNMQDKGGKKYLDFHQKLLDRPRRRRQGQGDGGRQGGRRRHGAAGKGHGQPGSEGDAGRDLQARRAARAQRHAELCHRQECGDRRGRPRRAEGEDQRRALRQGDVC